MEKEGLPGGLPMKNQGVPIDVLLAGASIVSMMGGFEPIKAMMHRFSMDLQNGPYTPFDVEGQRRISDFWGPL